MEKENDDLEKHIQVGSRPVPDPTTLTTAALNREIMALKELVETRLDGYDKAITLLQSRSDKSPSIDVVDAQNKLHTAILETRLLGMDAKYEEKFHNIETQFNERDVRTEERSKDSKEAIAAALQAAKEAVGEQNKSSALAIAKSEASTTKQIDSIGVQILQANQALSEKIEDARGRLLTVEGKAVGLSEQKRSSNEGISNASAIIMIVFGAITILISIGSALFVLFGK